jgi:ribosomal protein S18 acetylase RimI-like enzyme
MTVQNKPEPEHRHIDWQDLNLIPRLVSITNLDKNELVGTALFFHAGKDAAILWDIYIEPAYRRQYYASHLLAAAKKMFNEIATDWRSQAGHDFCLKNGFRSREFRGLRLVWRRDENKT